MNDLKKVWLILLGWTFLLFCIGLMIGIETANESLEKESIRLSIELTKLEIQKLKDCKELSKCEI